MASMEGLRLISLLLLVLTSSVVSMKTYIVQMKQEVKPAAFVTNRDWYLSSLHSVLNTENINVLYAYTDAYNGFAASLEPQQAEELKQSGSVLGVFEDVKYKLHTTRTPQFLNIDDEFGLWKPNGGNTSVGGTFPDVVIGLLDTGVNPDSLSFNDAGFPEIPKKWKGFCQTGPDFDPAKHCNRKLIGATYFVKGALAGATTAGVNFTDIITPRDHQGHGTHTASTAAGSPVPNANLFGRGIGTARGMAPHARIATYKVCWTTNCATSDILAGLDQAIKDGVDVISMSLGGDDGNSYYENALNMGTLSAMENGIFISASAGNDGPSYRTLSNGAPWIMTVGASSLDRDFPVYVSLGNRQRLQGTSFSGGQISGKQFPLVYASSSIESKLCSELDPRFVQGKVVICDRGQFSPMDKSLIALQAGAAGMILCNTQEAGGNEFIYPSPFMLPAVHVAENEGDLIKSYVMSDPNPVVTLTFVPERINVRPSPVVASFSSRGPYPMSLQILKPDIIAPGVDILASWNGTNPSDKSYDTRIANFNIISGTSMSCPHISGIAALFKAAHPEWSPSAIKSALMTTAYVKDNTRLPIREETSGKPADPWGIGAGHVDPRKALDPGLIYDITPQDYVKFICSFNYTLQQVQLIARNPNITCAEKFSNPGELNYPSFSVVFSESSKVVQYIREVTNVGAPGVYRAVIQAPPTVTVEVTPRRLAFKTVGEKAKYQVTFASLGDQVKLGDGSISWVSGRKRVRSPFVFMWKGAFEGLAAKGTNIPHE